MKRKSIACLLLFVLAAIALYGCGTPNEKGYKTSDKYGYDKETGQVTFPKTTEDVSKIYDMNKVSLILKSHLAKLPVDCARPEAFAYQNQAVPLEQNSVAYEFMNYVDYAVVIQDYIKTEIIDKSVPGVELSNEIIGLNPKDELIIEKPEECNLTNEMTTLLKVFFAKTGFYKVSYSRDTIRFCYLREGMKAEKEIDYYVAKEKDATYRNSKIENRLADGWVCDLQGN